MPTDRTTTVLLAAIALFLGIIAFRQDQPAALAAAAKPIEYKVVSQKIETFPELEAALNEYGKDGWRLVTYGFGPMIFFRQ